MIIEFHAPHPITWLIDSVIVLTQSEVGWFVWRDGKSRLSTPVFRAATIFLCLSWILIGIALLVDLSGIQYISFPVLRWVIEVIGAFCTSWGFASGIAINLYLLISLCPGGTPPFSPERRRIVRGATAVAISAPFAMAGYGGIIERTAFQVTEVDFPIPNLHPDLEGLRIAQISDLHVSHFFSVQDAARVVDMTNELKPALTLVTGDLITAGGDPLDETIRELARLRADAGVLGCLGNHEIYAKCQAYATAEAAKYGIQFLRQRAMPLRWGQGTLNVAGVDFQSFGHKETYLKGAESLVVPGSSNLLLSHNPDVFPAAVRKGYDAMLSGHTHGGQVTVEILRQDVNLARFFTPFVAGLYRIEGRSAYVNTGIGTIGMPVRLGVPPEITLLKLRRA